MVATENEVDAGKKLSSVNVPLLPYNKKVANYVFDDIRDATVALLDNMTSDRGLLANAVKFKDAVDTKSFKTCKNLYFMPRTEYE